MTATFTPGDLVLARGREWVALPSPEAEWLCLRPLSGAEADITFLHPSLERDPVKQARFSLPEKNVLATQSAALILSEALRLSLRRGAGPFRSAARLSFEPRAYQLVPLLMALRLPVVRLLIADDVGIGKTIEAGLVLRELIDRGEIDRFSVLCPPHLVEQWTDELKQKFDIDAVPVTAASAAKLERGLLASQTLFDAHPFTVVSLDYIKADKRRDSFSRACPSFVIIDEAHACVGTHQGRQQRFELLKRLSENKERHMVLLTATPHSGDEDAFDRLLGLLDDGFSRGNLDDENFRARLAKHFVQRRRIDITGKDWNEERTFPKHETAERPYELNAEHKAFHDAVLDYCLNVVEGAGPEQGKRRLAFWGTLALMRCVGSSPAAALSALRNRLAANPGQLEEQVYDDEADEADAVDLEPASGIFQDKELTSLVSKAENLISTTDPKLQTVIKLLKQLIKEGANPVIFCRFIATAEHVAAALRKEFPKICIEAVTGALTADERRLRVDNMVAHEQRLLVATDCLSEGINLQSLFDAVIHYDLSWNPTRHQQREGRVDRYGQPSPLVRSILLYSPDSAVDGAVLDVILRKAKVIREKTGVTVPLPEEKTAVTGALMNAVLLRKGKTAQLSLDLGISADAEAIDTKWRNAEEGEKRSRARFAQNAIKPEEVAPEWKRWRELLGSAEEVEKFVERAMSRLDAPLQPAKNGIKKAHVSKLPRHVSERLASRGLEDTVEITFTEPAPPIVELVNRSHALPSVLAEALLEAALDPQSSPIEALGRMGVWSSPAVKSVTTIALLRLRYKLTVHSRKERLLLVEEAEAIAFENDFSHALYKGQEARSLLESEASGNLAEVARERLLNQARERINGAMDGAITAHARLRAEELTKDHERVRATGVGVPKVTVDPVLPADIVGLYVLVPAEG